MMADEAVAAEAVGLDVKGDPAPKDLAEAVTMLEVERAVNQTLSEAVDKAEAATADAMTRVDALANTAAELAPEVSRLAVALATAQMRFNEEMTTAGELRDFLIRTIQTLEKHHVLAALPADIRAWWDAHRASVEAADAALRASGLAKLTAEEIRALGLG